MSTHQNIVGLDDVALFSIVEKEASTDEQDDLPHHLVDPKRNSTVLTAALVNKMSSQIKVAAQPPHWAKKGNSPGATSVRSDVAVLLYLP